MCNMFIYKTVTILSENNVYIFSMSILQWIDNKILSWFFSQGKIKALEEQNKKLVTSNNYWRKEFDKVYKLLMEERKK